MGIKVKPYNNVPPKKLAKIKPGRKPKTPEQRRRALSKEADAEFLADLKP